MAELGPHLTLACPTCKQPVRIEITVVNHGTNGRVLAELDKSAADQHVLECAGKPATTADQVVVEASTEVALRVPPMSKPELAGRINRMLDMRAYATPGKRACTMCGTSNDECMTSLSKASRPCCSVCGEDDTHPVPNADVPCAEWGQAHGAKN